jgi:hypothetical protein
MRERILHVALRTDFEKQLGLDKALRAASSDYRDVDWQKAGNAAEAALCAASEIRPTLVFMQLQCGGVLEPRDIAALRPACDPQVIIVNWDGDQHHEPEDEARRWFVELGRACDASFVTNRNHPYTYKEMGVRNAGYLQIGYDHEIYRPVEPWPDVPPVVFLGSRYPSHQRRNDVIEHVAAQLGSRFAAYGNGWPAAYGRPMLKQHEEPHVYTAAKAAISMSIRKDLTCYTSDRLFRIMGSGGVALVEWFPGMLFLGVTHETSIAWSGPELLVNAIRLALGEDTSKIRTAAAETARYQHAWDVRVDELLAKTREIRAANISPGRR